MLITGWPFETQVAADDIKEHNPALKDGKEWLKNSLRPFLENPNIQKTKVDIAHIAADGDMVWLLVKGIDVSKWEARVAA